MFSKYVLPMLAVAGVSFAGWMVVRGSQELPPAQPVSEPATSEFSSFVAGAGLVEAATENIAIGPVVPGVVQRVYIKVGDSVKAGDPLFTVDDRDLKSQRVQLQSAVDAATARLARLQDAPRLEDIPPAQARVAAAEAQLADAQAQLQLYEELPDRRAVTQDDFNRRRFAVELARANLQESKAQLDLLMAGSWKQDILVAQAELDSAKAAIAALDIELDRRTTRASVDGTILQCKVRPGEYAPTGLLEEPLILMGATDVLHVRVDVDENDAWRVRPGARATAYVRGNRDLTTQMTFVRVEPYVIPKRSLTGQSTERVDTRVLQVVYAFEPGKLPVYVGQQMDVFIEAGDVVAGR